MCTSAFYSSKDFFKYIFTIFKSAYTYIKCYSHEYIEKSNSLFILTSYRTCTVEFKISSPHSESELQFCKMKYNLYVSTLYGL